MILAGEIVYLYYPDRPTLEKVVIGKISHVDDNDIVVDTRFGSVNFLAKGAEWVNSKSGDRVMTGVVASPEEKVVIMGQTRVPEAEHPSDDEVDNLLRMLRPDMFGDTLSGVVMRPTIPMWRSAVRDWYKGVQGNG